MLVYEYSQTPARRGEAETVFRLGADEGRDVEDLACPVLGLPCHGSTARRREHVVVHLAEGVAHLAHHRAQRTVPMMAVPDAHGIEDVAQHPREAQQIYRAALECDAALRQQRIQPGTQRPAVAGAVVAVMEAVEIKAVMRKKAKTPVQLR